MQLIELSSFVTPDGCAAHTAPPFDVFRITPPWPTAQQEVLELQATPRRAALLPEVCAVQVEPASTVPLMLPRAPTTMHVDESEHAAAFKLIVRPEV
jgi:hypothetical protein